MRFTHKPVAQWTALFWLMLAGLGPLLLVALEVRKGDAWMIPLLIPTLYLTWELVFNLADKLYEEVIIEEEGLTICNLRSPETVVKWEQILSIRHLGGEFFLLTLMDGQFREFSGCGKNPEILTVLCQKIRPGTEVHDLTINL